MAAPAGAVVLGILKRVAVSLGLRAAQDPEKAAGCTLQIVGVTAGLLVVGALFLGALAAAVPTVVFGGSGRPDMPAVIADYLELAAKIGNTVAGNAQAKADAKATGGELTDVQVSAPDWRYLVAIAAVQCDQDFDHADLRAVERAVLAHVTYSTATVSTTPTETVVVSAEYADVGTVALDFPLPATALFTGRENEAAEIYLSSLSSVNEEGRYDPFAAAASAGGGVGMTPEIAAQLKASGVVIEPGSPVETALSYLGTPYHWGATGKCPMDGAHGTANHPGALPNCFDCSGLMIRVYTQHGLQPPRVSKDQAKWGTPVTAAQLQPGDLVFFGDPTVYHVGMYIGGGYFVHSPKTHDVVKISLLANRKDFVAARRWDWQPRTAPVWNPRTDPHLGLPQ